MILKGGSEATSPFLYAFNFNMSPGVILVNRVASRYAVSYCGIILLLAAFLPKLTALLALVPAPVVGAALCVAMGRQVGAGIAIIASKEITSWSDYPSFWAQWWGFFLAAFLLPCQGFLRCSWETA